MMKLEKIKKIPIILCGALFLIANIEECSARTLSFPARLTTGGGGSTEIPYTEKTFKKNGSTYRYRYKKIINTNTIVDINAYDINGESLIPAKETIEKGKTFKAGTWIGINVMETHTAAWAVEDFQVEKLITQYTCNYKKNVNYYKSITSTTMTATECARKRNGKMSVDGTCTYETYWYSKTYYETYVKETEYETESTYKCPDKHPNDSTYKVVSTTPKKETKVSSTKVNETIANEKKQEIVAEVYNAAKSAISYSATSVKYINNNKYPGDKKDLTTTLINDGINKGYSKDTYKSGDESGTIEKNYEILEQQVCMNLKTSEVSYGRTCDSSKSEIKIETGTAYESSLGKNVNYWHYFIPLNTKSNQDFYLDVVKNENSKFGIDNCLNFMKKEKNYQELITPINAKGESQIFIGDYHKFTDKSISKDKKILEEMGYCGISARIKFPISQEFYKETDESGDEKKLKGFNFYYRPIDINNPFPNGVGTNSIWSEWNKSTSKTPDITKSYTDITYIASNINSEKIRNYNKNNSYTSWSNMNIDGTSRFIDKESVVVRNTNKSFYGLGCGPANEKKVLPNGNKNHLYIKGCDK